MLTEYHAFVVAALNDALQAITKEDAELAKEVSRRKKSFQRTVAEVRRAWFRTPDGRRAQPAEDLCPRNGGHGDSRWRLHHRPANCAQPTEAEALRGAYLGPPTQFCRRTPARRSRRLAQGCIVLGKTESNDALVRRILVKNRNGYHRDPVLPRQPGGEFTVRNVADGRCSPPAGKRSRADGSRRNGDGASKSRNRSRLRW